MAISVRAATPNDCGAIAVLWNTLSGNATSCFYGAIPMSAGMVASWLKSFEWFVAESDPGGGSGAPSLVAFGFWSQNPLNPLFITIGASASEAYYRLFRQCAKCELARGLKTGYSVVKNLATTEMGWINALGVAKTSPTLRDARGNTIEWRVEADNAAVAAKITALIGA